MQLALHCRKRRHVPLLLPQPVLERGRGTQKGGTNLLYKNVSKIPNGYFLCLRNSIVDQIEGSIWHNPRMHPQAGPRCGISSVSGRNRLRSARETYTNHSRDSLFRQCLSTIHLYAKFRINGRSRSVWMHPRLVARTLNFGPVYSTSVSEQEGRCVRRNPS